MMDIKNELKKMDSKYGWFALGSGLLTLYFARKQGMAQGAGLTLDTLESYAKEENSKVKSDD